MTREAPRATHLQQGDRAENQALEHLQTKGLELLQRNYRCRAGELDLVMRHDDLLVFVEVRYRRSNHFGGAVQSIDSRKQKKLRLTAESFLQRHSRLHFDGCRFDVVAVCGGPGNYRIDWIQDAFS